MRCVVGEEEKWACGVEEEKWRRGAEWGKRRRGVEETWTRWTRRVLVHEETWTRGVLVVEETWTRGVLVVEEETWTRDTSMQTRRLLPSSRLCRLQTNWRLRWGRTTEMGGETLRHPLHQARAHPHVSSGVAGGGGGGAGGLQCS